MLDKINLGSFIGNEQFGAIIRERIRRTGVQINRRDIVDAERTAVFAIKFKLTAELIFKRLHVIAQAAEIDIAAVERQRTNMLVNKSSIFMVALAHVERTALVHLNFGIPSRALVSRRNRMVVSNKGKRKAAIFKTDRSRESWIFLGSLLAARLRIGKAKASLTIVRSSQIHNNRTVTRDGIGNCSNGSGCRTGGVNFKFACDVKVSAFSELNNTGRVLSSQRIQLVDDDRCATCDRNVPSESRIGCCHSKRRTLNIQTTGTAQHAVNRTLGLAFDREVAVCGVGVRDVENSIFADIERADGFSAEDMRATAKAVIVLGLTFVSLKIELRRFTERSPCSARNELRMGINDRLARIRTLAGIGAAIGECNKALGNFEITCSMDSCRKDVILRNTRTDTSKFERLAVLNFDRCQPVREIKSSVRIEFETVCAFGHIFGVTIVIANSDSERSARCTRSFQIQIF